MSMGFFKNGQAWFTKSVLIVLAVTFVVGFGYVGGISIGGGGAGSTTAVKVNGEKVPLSRYYMVRENLYRRFSQGSDSIPEAARDFINHSAMTQLIESKLLAQKARELGFTISDEELSEAIQSNPSFQYNGQFIGKQNYEETVKRALNISVAEFEKGFRDELLVRKLVDLIEETAKVTDEELLNLYRMQNEQIKLNYIAFSPDDFKNPDTVKESEIREYYEKNRSAFNTPEERNTRYIRITADNFEEAINITDDEIEAYYNSYKSEFKDEDGSIKELSSAVREEIRGILKDRKSVNVYSDFVRSLSEFEGENLQKILTENSLSGEISETGYITASENNDRLPQYVIDRAFNIEEGQLANVRGQNELWLLKLVDKKEPGQKSFEEVKGEIADILMTEKAKTAAKIAAEETLNKIKNTGNSLNRISASTISEIRETDYFTRTEAPSFINSDEDMKLDAFMLTEENPVASRVYSSGYSYYILSLKDRKSIDVDEFRENRDEIEQQELVRLRRNILSGWIDDLYSKADIVYNDKALPELAGTPGSS